MFLFSCHFFISLVSPGQPHGGVSVAGLAAGRHPEHRICKDALGQ